MVTGGRALLVVGLLSFGPGSRVGNPSPRPGYSPEASVVSPTPRRPITLDDLLRLRDIAGLAISPDGRFAAVVVIQADLNANNYRTSLLLAETAPGGRQIALGSLGTLALRRNGEAMPYIPRWSPNSSHLVVSAAITPGSRQLWVFDVPAGRSRRLTDEHVDVLSYEFADDTTIAYVVNAPALSADARREAWRRLYDEGIRLKRYQYPPYTGSGIIDKYLREEYPSQPMTKAVTLTTGRAHALTRSELLAGGGVPPGAASLPPEQFVKNGSVSDLYLRTLMRSRDRKVAAYSKHDELGTGTLANYDVFFRRGSDRMSVRVTHGLGAFPPTSIGWSSNDRFYFSHFDGIRFHLYSVAWPDMRLRDEYSTDGAMRDASVSDDGRLAVFVESNATTPDQVAFVDLARGTARIVFNPNPGMAAIAFSETRRLEWENRYGDRGFGYLVFPAGYRPGVRYPLVVTSYRASGFLRGGTGDEYPIHYLATQGLAVLAFDAGALHFRRRGSALTETLRWLAPTDAVGQLLEQVDRLGIVDPSRRAMTGLSFGADLASYIISHRNWFRTAIISGGSADPAYTYVRAVASYEIPSFGGDQMAIPGDPFLDAFEKWKVFSPALNVDSIHASLLINAADREVFASTQLSTAMKERRKPVEMWVFADESHVKVQPRHRRAIYQRNVDWLRFWLQDYEDPSPGKVAQYQRWRELRTRLDSIRVR